MQFGTWPARPLFGLPLAAAVLLGRGPPAAAAQAGSSTGSERRQRRRQAASRGMFRRSSSRRQGRLARRTTRACSRERQQQHGAVAAQLQHAFCAVLAWRGMRLAAGGNRSRSRAEATRAASQHRLIHSSTKAAASGCGLAGCWRLQGCGAGAVHAGAGGDRRRGGDGAQQAAPAQQTQVCAWLGGARVCGLAGAQRQRHVWVGLLRGAGGPGVVSAAVNKRGWRGSSGGEQSMRARVQARDGGQSSLPSRWWGVERPADTRDGGKSGQRRVVACGWRYASMLWRGRPGRRWRLMQAATKRASVPFLAPHSPTTAASGRGLLLACAQ